MSSFAFFKERNLLDKNNISLIFNKTPFYGESGGQIGDAGKITTENGEFICDISDTQKVDGEIYLHQVEKNQKKKIVKGKTYILSIDIKRRKKSN